jgi:signal peptidase I
VTAVAAPGEPDVIEAPGSASVDDAGDADAVEATPRSQVARRRTLLAVRIASAAWTTALVALLVGLAVLVLTGWRLDVVTSPSMAPAIAQGSAVLARPVDDSTLRSLEPGDVITFEYPQVDALVMHRIVEVRDQGGQRFFTTQGDANPAADARLVPGSDVEAEVRTSLPIVGRILTALQPPSGVVLLVVVPLLLALARHLLAREPGPATTDLAAADLVAADLAATDSSPTIEPTPPGGTP